MGTSTRWLLGAHTYPRTSSQRRWHSSIYSTIIDPSVIAGAWAVKCAMISFFLRQHVPDRPSDCFVVRVCRLSLRLQAIGSSSGVIEKRRHRLSQDSRGGVQLTIHVALSASSSPPDGHLPINRVGFLAIVS